MARVSSSTKFSSKFSSEIELKYVRDNSDSYLTTILSYCEENQLDYLDVPKLLSKVLKDKLLREGVELGHLRSESKPVHTF